MKEREPISRRVIRRLEDEIVSLDRDYTALLRKKWLLEEKMREQKDQIAELEITTHSEVKKRSFWKKVLSRNSFRTSIITRPTTPSGKRGTKTCWIIWEEIQRSSNVRRKKHTATLSR